MTRRRRPSRFRDRAAMAAVVALALAAGVTACPRTAAAQACCVGTGLVTPARLRTFEDRAVGVQMRARSVMGAFAGSGSYATSAAGTRDVGFEEDLFGALRLGPRLQVALLGAVRPDVARRFRRVGLRRWPRRHHGQRALRRHQRGHARPSGRASRSWPALAVPTGHAALTRRTIRWRRRAQEPDRTRAAWASPSRRSSGRDSCRCPASCRSGPGAPPTASSRRSPHGCRRC